MWSATGHGDTFMNHLHAISKLYHVAAILGSRPFVRYFTHNQCVFDITSERLHGWPRSQFCQGAGTALDLKSDHKALFKNIARELTSIAKEGKSYGEKLTEKQRNCHIPRNTDFVRFYQGRFGMGEVFEWINWYYQADPALRTILAPAKPFCSRWLSFGRHQ
jgi:hypothetical protein